MILPKIVGILGVAVLVFGIVAYSGYLIDKQGSVAGCKRALQYERPSDYKLYRMRDKRIRFEELVAHNLLSLDDEQETRQMLLDEARAITSAFNKDMNAWNKALLACEG